MTSASRRDCDLARWLFERETDAAIGAPRAAPAAHRIVIAGAASNDTVSKAVLAGTRVVERMQSHLSRWFGRDGFHALLVRALDRTRTTNPVLVHIYATSQSKSGGAPIVGPHGSSDLLVGSMPTTTVDAAVDAFVAIAAEIIALLARLVGEEMAARLVEEIWPASEAGPRPAVTGLSNSDSRKKATHEAARGAFNDRGETEEGEE